MKLKMFLVLGILTLLLMSSTTALAAPILNQDAATATNVRAALDTTFNVNVVFVGYAGADIDMPKFEAELAMTYDPIVRYPAFYGIDIPLDLHGEYAYNYVFASGDFNDNFFAYLASIGTSGPLTLYQTQYNEQVHRSLTIPDDVLYIDAPKAELWLMNHARADLGVDIGTYTVFYVNWYGRPDFRFHVYTKTDVVDPDTGYNFGEIRQTRKIIAWGGSYGRTWFYDLSAGPEAWTDNWNVDDADMDGGGDIDYRMPPVWEYGNLGGYRPFDNLSGDLGKVLRWVAIDLLFTTSPLYDPLASEPHTGFGKRVLVTMLEDDPNSNGMDWIRKRFIRKTLKKLQPNYAWDVEINSQPIKQAGMRFPFRVWAGINPANDCWNTYGTISAELFCHITENRNRYLPPPNIKQKYIGGIFAFNTTAERLGANFGLLGLADDDWLSGTPSYVFEFDTADYRAGGYGFSTTSVHEFGHHIGMSHPHDGYDSESGIDFGPTGDFYFAWSGDESHTIMSYTDLTDDFGWFDRDNMNRFLTARHIERGSEIAAQVRAANGGAAAHELLSGADTAFDQARAAYSAMDYERAAQQAKAGFERVWRAAQAANLNVPIVEPLPPGGPRRGPKMVDPVHPRRFE